MEYVQLVRPSGSGSGPGASLEQFGVWMLANAPLFGAGLAAVLVAVVLWRWMTRP